MNRGRCLIFVVALYMTCGSAKPYSIARAEDPVAKDDVSGPTKSLGYAFPREYAAIISEINASLQIPEAVLGRLIEWESGWDALCVRANPNGSIDYGLMQLNSRYLIDYKWRYNGDRGFDPLDPGDNLSVGMRHLRHLYDVTGNWFDAVCAYNAGLSRVRSGNVPEKTIMYANWVLEGGM